MVLIHSLYTFIHYELSKLTLLSINSNLDNQFEMTIFLNEQIKKNGHLI